MIVSTASVIKLAEGTFSISLAFQTTISRSNTDLIRIVVGVGISPYVDDYQIKNELGMSFRNFKRRRQIFIKSGFGSWEGGGNLSLWCNDIMSKGICQTGQKMLFRLNSCICFSGDAVQ